uniref:Uncharacterized protein n=1 Tax=Catharus ustulatus TaxID=91951 RepID=A0A8C3UZ88_CATUS
MESEPQSGLLLTLPHPCPTWNITCFSLKERLFLVRTLWLYLIIMKFLFFCFSLLEELANGLILVFFFTNSFLSVFPA